MLKSNIEASFNPIRMRILVLLSQNAQMSTTDIKENMRDVPQATLYRHINALMKANLIKVVQENKVRGAIEKIYSINMEINNEVPTDDEIIDVGYKFLLSIMGELLDYKKKEDRDVKKDMIGFQCAPLYLSDEEFMEFGKELGGVFQKYLNNKSEGDRILRNIYTIILPKK